MKVSIKRYLIIGGILLVVAVLATVTVFFLLQQEFKQTGSTASSTGTNPLTTDATSSNPATKPSDATGTQPTSITKDIPLRDLPLTETQLKVAETFGIDVETFVITPDMQYCAEQKLGRERLDEIIAGDAPSLSEGTTLLRCM